MFQLSSVMLPRKETNVPMSRGGSSARLNQMLSPSQSSFPSTPTSYQMSSLNPIRSVSRMPPKVDQEFEDKFNQLDIIKEIVNFETQLAELSRKVGSFDGNGLQNTVSALLESNQEISNHVSKLEKHKQLGETIDTLEKSKNELDTNFKQALKQLISYRTELKSLPSLPTKSDSIEEGISTLDVDEVLKYGLKLSKFTKAPPSTNASLQIHPNNFIWPAEDSLRRGMMAMCSLKGEEIIRKELGLDEQPEPEPESEAKPVTDTSGAESDSKPETKPERRSTRGTRRKVEEPEKPAPALDLDLFDPENEDDSD